mmetsp:Transcript_13275/g.28689  ORF Transcript_13275/g.28689 Transcript_13275/m.28689 type:complete len:225 (-) Transcript_13275:186-860(-)
MSSLSTRYDFLSSSSSFRRNTGTASGDVGASSSDRKSLGRRRFFRTSNDESTFLSSFGVASSRSPDFGTIRFRRRGLARSVLRRRPRIADRRRRRPRPPLPPPSDSSSTAPPPTSSMVRSRARPGGPLPRTPFATSESLSLSRSHSSLVTSGMLSRSSGRSAGASLSVDKFCSSSCSASFSFARSSLSVPCCPSSSGSSSSLLLVWTMTLSACDRVSFLSSDSR